MDTIPEPVVMPPIPGDEVAKFQGFKPQDRDILYSIVEFMGETRTSLQGLIRSGDKTNLHLEKLNGKVADQERRLSDFEGFKNGILNQSAENSRRIADKRAKITSSIWSILMFLITSLVAIVLSKIFHIDIRL